MKLTHFKEKLGEDLS